MRSTKTCVLVISLLESHIKHDPIAEIALLGCTVVEQESDKIESAGPAQIKTENDARQQHAIAMDQEHQKVVRCRSLGEDDDLTMYNIDSDERSPPASQLE